MARGLPTVKFLQRDCDHQIGFGVPGRFRPVGVHQDVRVDGNQDLPFCIDEITELLPVAFGNAGLQSFTLVGMAPQTEPARRPFREPQPQGLFHNGAQRLVLLARPGLRLP